jgi:hypothetical protein
MPSLDCTSLAPLLRGEVFLWSASLSNLGAWGFGYYIEAGSSVANYRGKKYKTYLYKK